MTSIGRQATGRWTRHRLPLVAALCALGLAVVAIAVPSASAEAKGAHDTYATTLARYASQTLHWSECYPGSGIPEFRCALVRAPRNWYDPAAGDIRVLVSRIEATGSSKGILLGNFGGPGVPSVNAPYFIEQTEPDLLRSYDAIGFDPRGSGGSTHLDCAPASLVDQFYALDGRDRSPENVKLTRGLSWRFAKTCARDPYSKYVNTNQTIHDVDLIRAIFRAPKLNYFGFSAGTWLGAWYAAAFPSRVGRFLLDGNANFVSTWDASFNTQPAGFQTSYEQFLLPWIARYDDRFGLGSTATQVKRTIEARRAALARTTFRLPDGSVLTPTGYDSGISSSLYWTGSYPTIATELSIVEHYATATPAERRSLVDWFGPYHSDEIDRTFLTITCRDTQNPTPHEVFQTWLKVRDRYPLLGSTWLANPCPYWPTAPVGSNVVGAHLPPLLMLQNDHDPATPFAGASAAHRATPRSVMVTVRNEPDHTIWGSGDLCVERIAADWLERGKLPAHDVSCPGVPLPDPSAATASAAGGQTNALAWLQEFNRTHGRPAVTAGSA